LAGRYTSDYMYVI